MYHLGVKWHELRTMDVAVRHWLINRLAEEFKREREAQEKSPTAVDPSTAQQLFGGQGQQQNKRRR